MVEVADVDKLLRLVIYKVAEVLVVVTEAIDSNAGGEVDVPVVLNIVEVAAVAFDEDLVGTRISCDHVGEALVHEGGALRVRGGIEGGELSFFLSPARLVGSNQN